MEEKDTRGRLIDAAFDEVYERGYQGAALADILAKAGVHKGSMYHFFANKKEMALAALKEKIYARFDMVYKSVTDDGAPYLPKFFARISDVSLRNFERGCPIANIVQEMSNIDADFDTAMKKMYADFRGVIKEVLDKAVESGELAKGCDTTRLSLFTTVVIEGAILSAKASGDERDYTVPIEELISYIKSYEEKK